MAKRLVAELSTKIVPHSQGLQVLFYRAALPLSHQTLTFVSGLIRAHRKELGSVWRKLDPGRQALLVLVYLRKGETFAEVGAGFGVSTTTCWRYVDETVELLAQHVPKLQAALRTAKAEGHAFVVLDGTLIPIDRIAADRPFYSGKHRRHGMNLQVIATPDGDILWVSGDLPGSTHDPTAARIWHLLAALRDADLIALADKGYHGYDPTAQHVITPYKGRGKPQSQKTANQAHARLRGPGERAHAQLKPGASFANSAAAHAAPDAWPKPSTSYKPTNSRQDEKGSMIARGASNLLSALRIRHRSVHVQHLQRHLLSPATSHASRRCSATTQTE